MNYQKHYDELIRTRKQQCTFAEYYEKHHIIPRCLEGSNKKDNIVLLTAREHYIAHWLLWKATGNRKLGLAFGRMSALRDKRKLTSKQYERAKIVISIVKTGLKHTEETKAKLRASRANQIITDEHKKNISLSNMGRIVTEETRNKISIANTGREHTEAAKDKMRSIVFSEERKQKISKAKTGNKLSEEHKKKISEAAKLREEIKRTNSQKYQSQ